MCLVRKTKGEPGSLWAKPQGTLESGRFRSQNRSDEHRGKGGKSDRPRLFRRTRKVLQVCHLVVAGCCGHAQMRFPQNETNLPIDGEQPSHQPSRIGPKPRNSKGAQKAVDAFIAKRGTIGIIDQHRVPNAQPAQIRDNRPHLWFENLLSVPPLPRALGIRDRRLRVFCARVIGTPQPGFAHDPQQAPCGRDRSTGCDRPAGTDGHVAWIDPGRHPVRAVKDQFVRQHIQRSGGT